MPQTLGNLVRVAINSDAFNLTADQALMGHSLEVVVPVANDAAGDTYATDRAAAGFAVSDARPLFVYNTTTKTVRIKDSAGWRDLGVAIRHAEYTGAAVNQTADAGVAFGVFTVDSAKTFGNTFSSANAGGGTLNILETGLYLVQSRPTPPSTLGPNVHVWAIASGGETFMSTNHTSYGNTSATPTTQGYLTSGQTLQFGVTGGNTVNAITSRVKITKLQG